MKYSALKEYAVRHPRLAGIHEGERAFAGPEEVWLDITNRCTTRCICCWFRAPALSDIRPSAEWGRQEMPTGKALALVGELADMGARRIFYSGAGDPLLHPGIFDILSATRRRGMRALLSTSFVTADDRTLDAILESGLDQLNVSLLAASPDTFALHHPGTPTHVFDRIVGLLRELVRRRGDRPHPSIILYTVMMRANAREVEPMVRLALDIGASGIWWNPMDLPSPRIRDLLLTAEQIARLREEMPRIREKYLPRISPAQWEILEFSDFLEKIGNSRAAEAVYHSDIIDAIPCYAGWVLSRILTDGTVVPCCKAGAFPIGNALRSSFRDVWYSPAYDEFRRRALTTSKRDPYFRVINCPTACDNHWWNKKFHREYHAAGCPLTRMGTLDRWRFRRIAERMRRAGA